MGRREAGAKLARAPHQLRRAIALLEHGRYIEAPDEREDYGEDGWVAVGQSPIRPGRLLLVAFTERGKIIRIIHARECSTREVERIFGDDA